MANIFRDKNILVTGGTGSIGSEIVRRLLESGPKVVRVISNDENSLFSLQQELKNPTDVRFLVGDIRDKGRMRKAVEGIDFIFHAAALKHVPMCEYNPFEAVKTNALGTQNLIEVALEEKVSKFITISTDKAVNPVNVMGATKLLAERLTISANYYKGARETVFACVRFGNVLDSRGSVVPLFQEQIKNGGPLTITDPEMTRFVMTLPRATALVLKAAEIARGGEIFIFKMSALRIGDLAEAMVEQLAPRYGYDPEKIKIEVTGKRAGERSQEELITEEESENAYEIEDMLVVMPAAAADARTVKLPAKDYVSTNAGILTKTQIKKIIAKEPGQTEA
jgi:UDP-N-acetylglucosamine 4,6-dehydratase/5-epimerase